MLHVPQGSKIGVHAQTNSQALFAHIDQAVAQGTPFPLVKLVDNLTPLAEVKRRSPATLTMGRLVNSMDGLPGIEDMAPDLAGDWAAYVMAPIFRYFNELNPGLASSVDVMEIVNEPDPNGPDGGPSPVGYHNMGLLMRACVELGRQKLPGMTWAICSWNAGTPEHSEMLAFLDSGVLAGAREAGDVVIAVHEGVHANEEIDTCDHSLIPGATTVPPGGGCKVGRIAYLAQLAGDDMVPVIVSEMVYGGGFDNYADIATRAAWADAKYGSLWYVLAALPFTHSPVGQWVDQSNYTPAYPALLQYAQTVASRQNAPIPAETPAETWQEVLWDLSVARQPISLNPDAALQSAILADGFVPVESEEWFTYDGVQRAYQAAETVDGSQPRRVYYAVVPHWDDVQWFVEPGTAPPPASGYDGFDAPIGTEEERRGDIWPGQWFSANSYRNLYTLHGSQVYHTGDDLNLNAPSWDSDAHAPVYAPAAGLVTHAAVHDDWGGWLVVVKHTVGSSIICSRLAHMEKCFVSAGDVVFRGDAIGNVGQSKNGPYHLHFDLADATLLADPGNWPGGGTAAYNFISAHYYNPRVFIEAHRPAQAPPPPPPPPGPDAVTMAPYFLPPLGQDAGDIVILANNWSGSQERQQLQRVNLDDGTTRCYVTKGERWEQRLLAEDGSIWLERDTSPNLSQYYTVSGGPWVPASWAPGDVHSRTETVQFFRLDDCQPVDAAYTVTTQIRFVAHHATKTTRAGVTVADVVELAWLHDGQPIETYFFARHLGLVAWEHADGRASWAVEVIPRGQQGDNQRGEGCYSL